MILDSLSRHHRYHALHPSLAPAFAWLESPDRPTADGRYAIAGDQVFALVQSYVTADPSTKRFEAHRQYLDLQLLVSGRERIAAAPLATLSPFSEYSKSSDVQLFEDPAFATSLALRADDFALLFPEDAHKPGCQDRGPEPVKKIVIKILH